MHRKRLLHLFLPLLEVSDQKVFLQLAMDLFNGELARLLEENVIELPYDLFRGVVFSIELSDLISEALHHWHYFHLYFRQLLQRSELQEMLPYSLGLLFGGLQLPHLLYLCLIAPYLLFNACCSALETIDLYLLVLD